MIIERVMIGHARNARVHVRATQLLGGDDFSGRRLHQRRPGQKDRSLLLDDDRLVRHCRHIGAARGARAHDHGDLRNALGGHRRLVVEDASEVVAVGKYFGLIGKVRAARVDEVYARQVVFPRDVLRAQMLLDRHRIVGATLDRRIVAHDHALALSDPADSGDDARRDDVVVVHAVGRELGQLEKRRSRVEERAHAVAGQELAASGMARARRFTASLLDLGDPSPQVGYERRQRITVPDKGSVTGVEAGFDDWHEAL